MDSYSKKQSPRPDIRVNLYGYLESNVGLGVAARNTLHMLVHNDIPVHGVDLSTGGHAPAGMELPSLAPTSFSGRGAVNLFHLNPDRLRYLIRPGNPTFTDDGRVNVAVPFWEAPRLPRAWLDTLRAMNLILAPTRFVLDAVKTDLPDANIVHYPQTVFLPDGIVHDRKRWDIPDGVTAFVGSFAVASDVERKNPHALTEAFLQAFGDDPQTLLIIKVNNPAAPGQGQAALQRLRQTCASHPNIRLIDEHLTYADVLSLYASCDVLVSLHRSEGLGLNMLEAMSLGVPVIATGWSGNMDFMNESNSIPVPYDLVDIDVPTSSPYHPRHMGVQTQWAEPHIEAAADAMRTLAEKPGLRAQLAEAGRASATASQEQFLAGDAFFSAIETELGSRTPHPGPSRAQETLKRRYVLDYSLRVARGLTRRIEARFNRSR